MKYKHLSDLQLRMLILLNQRAMTARNVGEALKIGWDKVTLCLAVLKSHGHVIQADQPDDCKGRPPVLWASPSILPRYKSARA